MGIGVAVEGGVVGAVVGGAAGIAVADGGALVATAVGVITVVDGGGGMIRGVCDAAGALFVRPSVTMRSARRKSSSRFVVAGEVGCCASSAKAASRNMSAMVFTLFLWNLWTIHGRRVRRRIFYQRRRSFRRRFGGRRVCGNSRGTRRRFLLETGNQLEIGL